MSNKLLRLNLACGSSKIDGYINIDVEPSCKPDLVRDFVKDGLPYKDNTVAEVLLFHAIEHIQKRLHKQILGEIFRVLRPGGRFLISYPEFLKCVDNWKKNYRGMKDFWEATIHGRQLYPSDYHICIMHTDDFKLVLKECGFGNIEIKPEPSEPFNTMICAVKGTKFIPYEEMLKQDMNSLRIKRDTKRNKRSSSH